MDDKGVLFYGVTLGYILMLAGILAGIAGVPRLVMWLAGLAQ